jgi:hypothetical protein
LNVGSPRFEDYDSICEAGLDIQQGHTEKEKKNLLTLLENLDKKAECTSLSDQEINLKHYLKERLVCLLREEELK